MKFVPSIRAARDDDAPYLQDIDIKCFEHTWLPDDWGILWESKTANVLVGCHYGTPVSFLAWELHEYKDLPALHVYKVAVKPLFRGNNCGKHLLANAYELLVKTGDVRYITIPVPESMTVGEPPKNCVGWLHKLNFKGTSIVDTQERLYGAAEDVILFVQEMP